MRSPAVLFMSVRIFAFSGGMSFIDAFFSSSIHFRNLRQSSSNFKAFQSSSSRDQLSTNLQPLFTSEFTLYQNTVESLRITWESIYKFESSDDALTLTYSADGFQDEPEYAVVEELEVTDVHYTARNRITWKCRAPETSVSINPVWLDTGYPQQALTSHFQFQFQFRS